MIKITKLLLFFFMVTSILPFEKTSYVNCDSSFDNYYQSESLRVPISEFVGALRSTIGIIQEVIKIIYGFRNSLGDFRLSNAITDCLELLDLSSDALSWSISASQSPNGSKNNSTGNLSSDLRTWLSAALVNQDTCNEGFEGVSGIIRKIVSNSLSKVTSRVQQLLHNVEPTSESKPRQSPKNQFPSWFTVEDREKLLQINGLQPFAIVALDGTGNYTKIMDAIRDVPDNNLTRHVIYIKKGVYNEYVEINKKKWNVMIVGDGIGVTVITGNRSKVDGWTTFRSATFAVSGRGFIARDITIENTAGAAKHQAVALRSDSDLSAYYRCEFRGYQDTLYTHTMRQFYRECKISGTVDFIFGDAVAMFQNCTVLAKKGLPDQKNTITAQGRKDPSELTGFSFQFCKILADDDLAPYVNSTLTYLGRPWKDYSRTIIMESYISDVVGPQGWLEWNGTMFLDTLYYGEYLNYGPGSSLINRIQWPGYHIFNESSLAYNFTVVQFIQGQSWLPETGISYDAGVVV